MNFSSLCLRILIKDKNINLIGYFGNICCNLWYQIVCSTYCIVDESLPVTDIRTVSLSSDSHLGIRTEGVDGVNTLKETVCIVIHR